jgi:PAS domain S-box-containing protein
MAHRAESPTVVRRRVAELEARLHEAEETLRAIRGGDVDAIVVYGPQGERVFTLRGAEHSYRVLVEAMSEGAATLSVDGTIFYCNRAFAGLVRLPLERLMGSKLVDLVAPADAPTAQALLSRRGSGAKGEVALRAGDGGAVPVYLSVNEMRVDGDEMLCVVATDLSEQKRNEEIVAAEKLARSVLDQAAEAIVVCDAAGRIIRASQSAHVLAGANPLQARFERAFPVQPLPPEDPDQQSPPRDAAGIALAALEGRTLRGVEARLDRGGAGVFELQVSAAPLPGARGEQAVGCVITLTDISERRRHEEERERLLSRVEALVLRLQDALRGRDEFLSIASHELKTPLTALQLHLDGLLRTGSREGDEPLQAGLRERIEAVKRQGRRLAHLVNDLLDVSRIRSGRLDLTLADVDLAAVAREVVERHRGEAQLAGTDLAISVDGPVLGRWDRSRLDQVITNLLSNALKYGKGKPVAVEVGEAAGRARLAVRDHGIGIAPEDHDRIFHRFERAASGTEFGGMGLGLWIAREIVNRLGGDIRVESALGQGARFLVDLPSARDAGALPGVEPAA